MADSSSSPAPSQESQGAQSALRNKRTLKSLRPNLTTSQLNFLLTKLLNKSFQEGEEYNFSGLLERRPGTVKLTYTENINQAYEKSKDPEQGHQDLLLPGDLVGFLTQLYYRLPQPQKKQLAEQLEQTTPEKKSPLTTLNDLFASLADSETIYRQSESRLREAVKEPVFSKILQTFSESWSKAPELDLPNETEIDVESQKASGQTEPLATAQTLQQLRAVQESGVDSQQSAQAPVQTGSAEGGQLISRDLENTISSLTVLSINSILISYTRAEDVPAINFRKLPPELREALFDRVRSKTRSFILGLSPEQIKQLSQDESQLRYKLLQEAHRYLRTSPQSRVLLQSAVEFYYQYQTEADNPQAAEKIKENYEQKSSRPELVEKELVPAADELSRKKDGEEDGEGAESFAGWLRNQHLDQKLRTTADLQADFVQKMDALLGEESRFTDAQLQQLNNSIAAVVLADPLTSPRFVEYMNSQQLGFFLGEERLPPEVFSDPDKARAVKGLIKEYWTVYQAKRLAKIKQEFPEAVVAQDATRAEAKMAYTPDRVDRTVATAKNIRAQTKEEGVEADQVLEELSQEKTQSRKKNTNQVYWEQLSDAKKRIYLRHVYGESAAQDLDNKSLDEGKVVKEFNHLRYLLALNDVFSEAQEFKNKAESVVGSKKRKEEAKKLIGEVAEQPHAQKVWSKFSAQKKQQLLTYAYGTRAVEKGAVLEKILQGEASLQEAQQLGEVKKLAQAAVAPDQPAQAAEFRGRLEAITEAVEAPSPKRGEEARKIIEEVVEQPHARAVWNQFSQDKKQRFLLLAYGKQAEQKQHVLEKVLQGKAGLSEASELGNIEQISTDQRLSQDIGGLVSEVESSQAKKAAWKALPQSSKQRHINYAYGSGALARFEAEEISSELAAHLFKLNEHIQAQNEAILLKSMIEMKERRQLAIAEFNFNVAVAHFKNRLTAARERRLAAKRLAVAETLYQLSLPTQTQFLQPVAGAVAASGQLIRQRVGQSKQAAGGVMGVGVDMAVDAGTDLALRAALDTVSSGAFEAYQAAKQLPIIGKMLNRFEDSIKKAAKEKAQKKAEDSAKVIGAAAAGAGAALSALTGVVSTIATGVGAVLGTVLGAALGPVGAIVGTQVGIGAAQYLTTGSLPQYMIKAGEFVGRGVGKIANLVKGEGVGSTLTQASENVAKAAKDLGSKARSATRPPGKASRMLSESQVAPGGAGQSSFWKNVASRTFSPHLLTSTSVAVFGTTMVMTVLRVSFMANFPYTGVETNVPGTNEAESRYAEVIKSVTPDCQEGPDDTCKNPNFDVGAGYQITITAKEGYTLEITGLRDELTVKHNEEKYDELGKPVPNIPPRVMALSDFNIPPENLTINPGETLIIEYEEVFDEDYNHARIRNKFDVNYRFSGLGSAGQDSLTVNETLRLGEAPQGIGCWPTTGKITQGPYDSFSHSSLDAYDIAPSAAVDPDLSSNPVYASFAGELCRGHLSSAYGEHLTLKAEIEGETYEFVFGHFVAGSTNSILGGNECVQVQPDDIIGEMGSTGYSTGTHLHFERRRGHSNSLTLSELMSGEAGSGEFSVGETVVSCYDE